MVIDESDQLSAGEVEQEQHDQSEDYTIPTLGRQSSIYSLTLDEFQHTLSDGGKNFGSMNMDEFLNSIWIAEEAQAHAEAQVEAQSHTAATLENATNSILAEECTSMDRSSNAKQSTLPRQGSLTLPGPLCRKTVEEVWAVIQKNEKDEQHRRRTSSNDQNPTSTQRQPTLGEMSLEDFLVKAGVVREQGHMPVLPLPSQYGLYQNSNNSSVGPGFIARPIVPYASPAPQSVVGETPLFHGSGKRSGGYQTPVVYTGGGYGPTSPVSLDGMGANHVDGLKQYGLDNMGEVTGRRKRGLDGPAGKVVERRQRRMIKNRESAARSRARKQAYTIELEAELNLLKQENDNLKQSAAELERRQKELERVIKEQYYYIDQEMRRKEQSKAERAEETLRGIRRHDSCPVFLKQERSYMGMA